jgi:hypothetical protein
MTNNIDPFALARDAIIEPGMARVHVCGSVLTAMETDRAADSLLFDLIRQQAEIGLAGMRLQDQAFELERDATDEQLADPLFCAKIEDMEEQGDAIIEQAGELFYQIENMIPHTIAGAIALIEFSGMAYKNDALQNAMAGLREIAAKGGAA